MQLAVVAKAASNVVALIAFAVPNRRPGMYYMRGTFSPESGQIQLQFAGWRDQPPGYIPVNVEGTVNVQQGVMAGNVLGQGCSTFQARHQ
jgi:hypothetical protein